MRQLREAMPGVVLPTYVLDIPGGYAKTDLESDNVTRLPDGRIRVRDDDGRWHDYAGA